MGAPCRWLGDPFGEVADALGVPLGPERVSLPYLAALERCAVRRLGIFPHGFVDSAASYMLKDDG